jgi:integrase
MDASAPYLSSDETDTYSSLSDWSSSSNPEPKTFADLIAATKADAGIPVKQRRDECAALQSMFKRLGHRPNETAIAGDPRELDRRLRALANCAKPPKGANLRNIRMRCRSAYHRFVAQAGLAAPEPKIVVIPPSWRELAAAFPHSTGFSVQRFVHFAVEHRLEPVDIDDTVVERFSTTLTALKHPRPHVANLIKGWNVLAAEPDRGLNRLSDRRGATDSYTVQLDELHPALQADIEDYFAWRRPSRATLSRRQPYCKPLKPSSAKKSVELVRQYLGLLRQSQVDIAAMQSLAEAVTLDNIETATVALLDRSGQETSNHLHNMLSTLSRIARTWIRMAPEDLADLAGWITEHRPHYDGMVARNIERLLVLQDPRNRAALLDLPFRLMELARRSESERGAYLAQKAVAIELLLQTAMRIGNLVKLRFDQHIIRSAVGRGSAMFVLVEHHEVKNGQAVRVQLPGVSAGLLEEYQQKFLPRLRNRGSGLLFPGKDGRAKGVGTFGKQLQAAIQEHAGLAIHPHLFRAIAVFIYLEHHPGDVVTMQRVLGDRSLQVVQKHYSFLDQIKARKGHQDAVMAERTRLRVRPPRRQGAPR